jgi:predicted nucleotidyltransferase
METTKNELLPYTSDFFNKLKNYLNTKIYFFGSIQRYDYFPNKSDIDVDIFTDNESKTISQIQNFLNIEKKNIKKFVYKFNNDTNTEYKLISGYKIKYSEPKNLLFVEFSIYNEKYKEFILNEHNRKQILPFYLSFFLTIIKYLYYEFCIIPKVIYKFFKNFLMNTCIDGKDAEFVVIDLKDDDEKDDE